MYVRTIVADLIPGKADDAVRVFQDEIVPIIREQRGYVSAAIYIDRMKNQAQTVSVWETKQDIEATSQASPYLGKVTGMLRPFIINRHFDSWEIGYSDSV